MSFVGRWPGEWQHPVRRTITRSRRHTPRLEAHPWHFNQGDVAALYIFQSSGSSIALTVGAYSTAFMYKIL